MDAYLSDLDEQSRAALERVRQITRRTVPDLEEATSYGMPAFKYRGRPVLGFTARKNHLSLHPFSPAAIEAVKDQLGGHELSKGTIRFTPARPLPEEVVVAVVRARMREMGGPA